MINLKVSEKEKFKNDGQWFKDYLNETLPSTFPDSEEYNSMLTCYKMVNNDLSDFKEKLKLFCDPLSTLPEVDEEVQAYPELHNSISILKGEIIQRREDLKLSLLSSDAVKEKDQEQTEQIRLSVDEKLGLELAKVQGEVTEEQMLQLRTQLEPADLMQKSFMSDTEIFFNRALEYVLYTENILSKKADTMTDLATVDQFYIYVGWKHGKPVLEIRNPLYVRKHKSSNEKYTHKSRWIAYQKPITLTEAIEAYNLSDEQIEELTVRNGKGLDKRHSLGKDNKLVFDKTRQDLLIHSTKPYVDKLIGLNQSPDDGFNNDLIWETHFEFKAYKELIFLTFTDEYGEKITVTLDSSFEIPKNATKELFYNQYDMKSTRYKWMDFGKEFVAEKIWLPRKYEIVRLDNNVYAHFGEVPYQTVDLENPFDSFSLSTKGVSLNARNAKSVSLVQKAIPSYLQYIFVKHIMNRELAAYQGAIQKIDIDQIPDSLGKDLYGDDIRPKLTTYLAMLRKTNKDIFSGSQTSQGILPPSTRSPGSDGYLIGTAVELMNLHQLSELIKQEIGMAMGISPQRQANFQQGSNVADNQRSISQSYAITEPYFYELSLVWKDALNDWLHMFRTYCETQMEIKGKELLSFQYWLPDGTEQLLKVSPKHLKHTQIGLFLVGSSLSENYANYMLQNIQAFSQNQGQGATAISQIIKDIVTKASPEEIHKRIQIEEQKSFERQKELQQMNIEAQEKLQAQQSEMAIQSHEFQKELIVLEETERRKTEVQKASISALGFAKDTDVDNNDVPDVIDMAKLSLAEKELNLKVKQHEDTMKMKEKELQVKRQKKQ
jgi:hypothetical protein